MNFLREPAGFDIGETGGWLVDATVPLWQAMLVGLSNTLRVSVPALAVALLLGAVVGLMRLSPQTVPRRLATAWVETLRNLPLLLQLLMWYFLLLEWLPSPEQPLNLGEALWLSKGGLSFPWWDLASGQWQWPEQGLFNVSGGATLTPEYLAVWLALSTYTSAYVAEIVRGAVQAVPRNLLEAADTLGATPAQVRWRVLWPQAWQLAAPPLSNQAINLVKNSSLAVAVGYPDLVSVGNTALNQTGRAVECMAVMMTVYLTLSWGLSWLLNVGLRLKAQRASA